MIQYSTPFNTAVVTLVSEILFSVSIKIFTIRITGISGYLHFYQPVNG